MQEDKAKEINFRKEPSQLIFENSIMLSLGAGINSKYSKLNI